MMIRTVSLLSMLTVAGMAHAQVHVYAEQNVNQNVGKVEQLGTAVFGTQYTTPTVSFVNGKAVMTIGNTTVASVPVSNGGVMVVDCCAFDEAADAHDTMNKITKSPSATDRPYVTLFSPFQVVVPEGCEVYAPEFDPSTETLLLTNANKLSAGDVVPVETPLVVKGDKSVDFTFSANHATCKPEKRSQRHVAAHQHSYRRHGVHLRTRQGRQVALRPVQIRCWNAAAGRGISEGCCRRNQYEVHPSGARRQRDYWHSTAEHAADGGNDDENGRKRSHRNLPGQQEIQYQRTNNKITHEQEKDIHQADNDNIDDGNNPDSGRLR